MDRPLDLTAPAMAGEPADRMRVLLVEDDDGDALLVEEELELSGARVDLERRRTLGEAASAGLQRFDCVLLDLDLPDAQGLEGLHELRELAPDLAVLVLTGLDDERRGIEAVGAGAQDYLIKGSTSGVLLARSLRYAVERRRAEHTQQQLSIAQLEARENARLERGLLPEPLVTDPNLTLASHYKPGRRRALLGGDFFDVVQTPGGTVHAIVGDVSGHGPDEAALGVSLRIAWRTLVLAGIEPEALLHHLQNVLTVERHARQVFTTVCMVSVDPARERATLRLAGTRRRCCSPPTGRRRSSRGRPARRWASWSTRSGPRTTSRCPSGGRWCCSPTGSPTASSATAPGGWARRASRASWPPRAAPPARRRTSSCASWSTARRTSTEAPCATTPLCS